MTPGFSHRDLYSHVFFLCSIGKYSCSVVHTLGFWPCFYFDQYRYRYFDISRPNLRLPHLYVYALNHLYFNEWNLSKWFLYCALRFGSVIPCYGLPSIFFSGVCQYLYVGQQYIMILYNKHNLNNICNFEIKIVWVVFTSLLK